jgi:antitoxin component HigA of HigAB toxin-antitoxin module
MPTLPRRLPLSRQWFCDASCGKCPYESPHHPIDPPGPIDAILFRLEQMGLTRNDLIDVIRSRARIFEVLNRRRPRPSP